MNYWADCLAWRERRRELLWEAQERALARAVRKTREAFAPLEKRPAEVEARWSLSKYEAKVAELLELNGMPPLDGVRGAVRRRRERRRVARGRVRRLIIRNQEDEVLLEVPLTAGVAVGGVVTLIAPVLSALGALAALLTHVKVEIVRTKEKRRRGSTEVLKTSSSA